MHENGINLFFVRIMRKKELLSDRLTDKQVRFIDAYVRTRSYTEAYLQAGYSAKDRQAAGQLGSALVKKSPKVAEAIERRLQSRDERLQLEDDYELKKAIYIFESCTSSEKPDYKNANAALMTICRLRGKFVEKKQIDMTLSDRSDWLAEALKE